MILIVSGKIGTGKNGMAQIIMAEMAEWVKRHTFNIRVWGLGIVNICVPFFPTFPLVSLLPKTNFYDKAPE